MISSRLDQLRARMSTQGLAALLVTARENIYYLSGFSGSSGALLITPEANWLISDFRYVLQAEKEAPGWRFFRAETTLVAAVNQAISQQGITGIGFDPHDLSVEQYRLLTENVAEGIFVPAPTIVEEMRLRKDEDELAKIKEAARITDAAYQHLLTKVAPGVSERDLALEAEWYARRHGAEAMAFDMIVASGPNSALPHAQPGERLLQPGDMVIVDMGARYNHYCADMTRTFAVGGASDTAREIYRVCLAAQLAGLQSVRASIGGSAVDGIVRAKIEEAGYGEFFGHGTGHGVGIAVHEGPRLARFSTATLEAGMVVTVEPGIYLPGVGGVRIEDLVIVHDDHGEIISVSGKPEELPVING